MKLQYTTAGDSQFQIRTTKIAPRICYFLF